MNNIKKYDLNSLLQLLNIAITLSAIYLYISTGGNQYVDIYTIFILIIFGMENHVLLLLEKRRREPLLVLLMITIIPFYMFRVATLLFDPWSSVLPRFPFTPDDLNSSLIFIMISVLCLALGIMSVKNKKIPDIPDDANIKYRTQNVIAVLLILFFLNVIIFFGIQIFGSLYGFIELIFNFDVVLTLSIVFFMLYKDRISKKYLISLYLLVILIVLLRTMLGSRSALLALSLILIYSLLSIKYVVRIRKSTIIILLSLIPVAVFFFGYATVWRITRSANLQGDLNINYLEFTSDYAKKYKDELSVENIKIILRPVFDRIGYLDMAADLITNNKEYKSIINPVYLIESIIDNALTPGFDIYDVAKVSNAMISIYHGEPPRKKSSVNEAYQSDMLTVYGEYYVLFYGYPAIIMFFISGAFFKKCLNAIKSKSRFLFYTYRALFFQIYVAWLLSFGLDWQVVEIVSLLITLCILPKIYIISHRFRPMTSRT